MRSLVKPWSLVNFKLLHITMEERIPGAVVLGTGNGGCQPWKHGSAQLQSVTMEERI